MTTKNHTIEIVSTKQFELVDITSAVKKVVADSKIKNGIVTVFVPHTTAAIKINHNEPLLMQDLMRMIYRLIPLDSNYAHDTYEVRSGVDVPERSNGHAHVKAFLLGASESIPVNRGEMQIGEKQSIWLVELDGGRKRKVVIQVMGE